MPSNNPARILVVEDDSTFRETVREILRDMGYKVRGARSVSKAIKRLTHHKFDLVLSDIQIGEGSGFDVIQIARQTRPNATIVLMSASADPDLLQAAKESGAIHFLPKPFGLKELLETLNTLLTAAPEQTNGSLPDSEAEAQP